MIEIQNLSKSYRTASGQVEALKDVSITIGSGDIYGIIGMSGAGKSTLVRCINMLERPSQGRGCAERPAAGHHGSGPAAGGPAGDHHDLPAV